MNPDVVRLLLIGPFVVLLLTAFLAGAALIAGARGRLEPFAARAAQMAHRLAQGRVLLALWGFAALFLLLLIAAILVNIKPLALLGILLLAAVLTLAGLGMGVSAVRVGRRFASVLGYTQASPLVALTVGMGTFFLAACVPCAGWLLVLVAVFAGTGAVLDTLLRRPAP